MGIPSSPGLLAAVCLALAALKGVSAVRLDIEPRDSIVFPGQNVSVLCRTGTPLSYCRFQLPSITNALNLNTKTKQTKDYAYYGSGLHSGQCGVTLFNIQDRFNGEIKCTVGVEDEAEESAASIRITVTRTPKAPELVVSPSLTSRGSNDYREGDILQASCVVRDARPVANITWFLGDDVVTSGIRSMVDADERASLYTIKQNLTRKLSWKDNSRELRCVVGHIALGPKNQTGKTFNVRYAPRDIQMPIEQFGFIVGETGNVVVEVLANPQPIFTWMVGNLQLTEGERDPTGKLEAAQGVFIPATGNESDVSLQGHGKWKAVLYISQVTNEDVEREYYLKARNMEGEKKYRVVISTLTEPQAMILGAGGIIAIVVAVLILLLIIILIIFARATGRWCFAGGVPAKHDPRESSDTESAENGTLEKKKKKPMVATFFKKKNDKVAADPEEVKTVPTDEEKELSREDGDNSLSDTKKDVVYAELDLQLNRSPIIIREDDKTEYAEIVHSKQDDRL